MGTFVKPASCTELNEQKWCLINNRGRTTVSVIPERPQWVDS